MQSCDNIKHEDTNNNMSNISSTNPQYELNMNTEVTSHSSNGTVDAHKYNYNTNHLHGNLVEM